MNAVMLADHVKDWWGGGGSFICTLATNIAKPETFNVSVKTVFSEVWIIRK
jgi:uncharacterized protein YndB with AHSA1/START domain